MSLSTSTIEDVIFGTFNMNESVSVVLQFEEAGASDDELIEALAAVESVQSMETSTESATVDTETPLDAEQKPRNLQLPLVLPLQKKQRFAVTTEDEMENIVSNINSKNTTKMTKWGVNQMKMWLTEREMNPNFEHEEPVIMDKLLARFYTELRNTDGNFYSKSTFVGLRASINRHLRSPPYNRVLNIMQDKDFTRSNKVFTGMVVKLKKDGLDKTTHHGAISESDLNKLRDSDILNTNSPKSLLRKVWFDLSLGFARRGQENVQELKKNSYSVQIDSSGNKYIQMSYNESTKNHPGANQRDDDTQKPRIYEIKTEDCPVASYEKYISKLNPDSDRLFQFPKTTASENDTIWYHKRPLGEKSIASLMKEISKYAKLSKIYTNHCVRATTITKLSYAGVDKIEIMKLTGHRNIKSIESYNSDSSEKQKQQYSSILQSRKVVPAMELGNHPCNAAPLSVITPPTNNMQNIQNNLTFTQPLNQQTRPMEPVYYFNNSAVHIHNYAT